MPLRDRSEWAAWQDLNGFDFKVHLTEFDMVRMSRRQVESFYAGLRLITEAFKAESEESTNA